MFRFGPESGPPICAFAFMRTRSGSVAFSSGPQRLYGQYRICALA